MYNYELLKEIGKLNKPAMVKRGLSATYNEWLMACEYIKQGGNNNILLCERGVRSFEPETRNMLDIQAVPYIKEKTNYKILVDPSHSAGNNYMIESMCYASVAAGCDGIMVEVHDNPDEALCDKEQVINIETLKKIYNNIKKIKKIH